MKIVEEKVGSTLRKMEIIPDKDRLSNQKHQRRKSLKKQKGNRLRLPNKISQG